MKAFQKTAICGSRIANLAMVFFALTCIAHGQPQIATGSPDFGIRDNAFSFTVVSASDPSVTIETCTNLANFIWTPLVTNALTGGTIYFNDVDWTNHAMQFYRARTTTSGQTLFSTNIVGYVNLSIRPGYNLLVNPLSVGLTNGANEIMPPIDGEQILTWSGSGFNYVSYDSGFGGWIDMNFNPSVPPSLPPGKGFFLFNPGYVVAQTFVGEVIPAPCTTNTIALPAGYSLIGSPLPANVYPIEAAPVRLPLIDGMQLLWWQGLNYDFDSWDLAFGGWIGCGFNPTLPPSYSVGQGFFFYNPGPAAGWPQTLPCP